VNLSLGYLFLNFDGRIPRLAWWVGIVCIMLPAFLISQLLVGLQAIDPAGGPPLLAGIISLFFVVPYVALTAKRFNDRGHNVGVSLFFVAIQIAAVVAQYFGWFVKPEEMGETERMAFLVLLGYSLWVFVDNGFLPGTQGPNQYGPDPLDRAP